MRYHTARVVLGACLIAAAAAAQAPASPSSSSLGSSAGSNSVFDAATAAATSFGGTSQRSYADRVQDTQEQDYTLRGQFSELHGEFMSLRERYNPQLELRARAYPNLSIQDEPGNFDLLGYDFDLDLPVLISPESYLIFGTYYQGRRYLTSSAFGTKGNGAGNGIGDETLIAAGVKLGFGVFLDKNVLFEMQTNPGAYSDMDDTLHHQDFDFPSSALFTIRAMDRFFFKVGARYNQVFEEAPWLPILGFSWEIVEGFRLDILAPQSIELSFWPSASTGFLLGGQVTGAEYHVHTAEALNQRSNVRVQEAVAYLGFIQRMTDSFSFEARGGVVCAGDYTLSTGAAGFNPAEGALSQAFYGEVSLGVNF